MRTYHTLVLVPCSFLRMLGLDYDFFKSVMPSLFSVPIYQFLLLLLHVK